MKKLAILLVLVLLLGGAGGAGWWFFLREQPEADSAEAAEESVIRAARVIKLDPIILPVIREGQVTLHVTVVVVIELTEVVAMAELRVFSHALRDTMLSELHGMYASRFVQKRGYDLPIIRERLSEAAERVLGAGSVKRVLLKDVNKRSFDTG